MVVDWQILFLVWTNGVVFGLLAALLACRRFSRHVRYRKSPESADSPSSGRGISRKVQPPGTTYPSTELAALTRDLLPAAEQLPPLEEKGIEWAWSGTRYRRGDVVVVPTEEWLRERLPTFVLGDLHGDIASLRRILSHVWSIHPRSRVVFLGDLVDRAQGADMLECARLFVWAAKQRPGRFLWIRGNHDYLARNAASGRFCTSVEPHEFADFLNERPDLTAEGEALGKLMDNLPEGAVLGNVWLSHGGVLQDDAEGLRSFAGFAAMTDEMKRDLVWTRMRDVPTKLANRGHAGAEVGLRQAQEFARRVRETEGMEIAHLVCAHQHASRDGLGYLPFDHCYTASLTCQCICSCRLSKRGVEPAILRLDGAGIPVPVVLVEWHSSCVPDFPAGEHQP